MDHYRADDRTEFEALIATLRILNAGVWTCAALTMGASMLNGYLTFDNAQPGWALAGLATAISIDAALCLAIVGDRRLHHLGLSSGWKGRALRWATAAMSITLSCALSAQQGHILLTILHAFLPLTLIGVTEYHETVALALHQAVVQVVEVEPEPAALVPSTPEPLLRAVPQPTTERSLMTIERSPQLALATSGRAGTVKNRALEKLREWRAAGRELDSITHTELAGEIDAKLDTCYRGLSSWRTQVLEEVAS